ncbi:hypothetical protein BGZ63DRAFT_401018 [Mariannaea sp. PMI_226]|nr:hypothetical protein BGZ63DRAFT_401018 [Mariannaea sp. PMI_226]
MWAWASFFFSSGLHYTAPLRNGYAGHISPTRFTRDSQDLGVTAYRSRGAEDKPVMRKGTRAIALRLLEHAIEGLCCELSQAVRLYAGVAEEETLSDAGVATVHSAWRQVHSIDVLVYDALLVRRIITYLDRTRIDQQPED